MALPSAVLLVAASMTVAHPTTVSSVKGGNTGDIADAVATLAKMDWEVDIQSLSQQLKLPQLQDGIKWQAPFARYEAPMFSAYYDPVASEFGITKISIFWQIGNVKDEKGNPAIFNYLLLNMAPGRCLTAQRLTEALGAKPLSMQYPGVDGGPSSEGSTFMVPQNHGAPIQVSYFGQNTCRLTVSHIREL